MQWLAISKLLLSQQGDSVQHTCSAQRSLGQRTDRLCPTRSHLHSSCVGREQMRSLDGTTRCPWCILKQSGVHM